ncbi:MAG: Prochlorococcus phage [Bacteroidota bacterium]|jgi:hypothetical protein
MLREENMFAEPLKNAMNKEFGSNFQPGMEFLKGSGDFLRAVKEEDDSVEGETNEVTGVGSSGSLEPLFSVKKKELEEIKNKLFKKNKGVMKTPIGKLYGATTSLEEDINEKWSQKYKDSIDCKNPKGFSQKAYCQGKKKKVESKESMGAISGGSFEPPVGFKDSEFVRRSFAETPKKIEANEATGSGSSGSYVTPAAWAKSTKKKDWRGKSKTQIPGGKFVTVKKKCKKFPYCNQGDIGALKFTNENKDLLEIIKNVSQKQGISENMIKNIIFYDYMKNKTNK